MKVSKILLTGLAVSILGIGTYLNLTSSDSNETREVLADDELEARDVTIRINTLTWRDSDYDTYVFVYNGEDTEGLKYLITFTDETRINGYTTINVNNSSVIKLAMHDPSRSLYFYSKETTIGQYNHIVSMDGPLGAMNLQIIKATYPDGFYLRFEDHDTYYLMDASDKTGYNYMYKDLHVENVRDRYRTYHFVDGVELPAYNSYGIHIDDPSSYSCSDNVKRVEFDNPGIYDVYVNFLEGEKESDASSEYYIVTPTYKFANLFLSNITCPGEVYSGGTTKWNEMSTAYSTMLNDRAKSKYQDGTKDKDGDAFENALARYDHILGRYGTSQYTNFMNRTVTPLTNQALNISLTGNMNNDTALLVTLISIISIGAIGGFFFLKKKKISK